MEGSASEGSGGSVARGADETRAALVATILAIGVGLLYKGLLGHPPGDPIEHSGGYARIANHLLVFGRYSLDGAHATAYRPPGYPFALLPVVLLPGALRIVGFVVQQAAFFFIAARIGAHVVVRLGGGRIALATFVLLLAGHLSLVDETLEARETLFFAAVAMVLFASLSWSGKTSVDAARSGFASGVLALVRPTGILVALATAVFRRPRIERRQAVVILAIAAFTLLPWQFFLATRFGSYAPAGTTTAGLNLLKGNNPSFERYYPLVDVDIANDAAVLAGTVRAMPRTDDPAIDRAMRTLAIAYVLDHPFVSMGRAVEKAVVLFSPLQTPAVPATALGRIENLDVRRLPIPRMRKLDLLLRAIGPTLLCLGVFLALRRAREHLREEPFVRTFAIALAALTLVHAITFSETRFRLPFDFGLAAIAAVGIGSLVRDVLARRMRRAADDGGRAAS